MRTIFELRDFWQKEEAKNVFSDISLPAVFPSAGDSEATVIRRKIQIPSDNKNDDFYLEIKGFSGKLRALIDGKAAGEAGCFIAPRYISLTQLIVKGETQELTLELSSPDGEKTELSLFYAGIIGLSRSHFDVTVNNDPITVSADFGNGFARVDVFADVVNPNNYDVVIFTIYSPDGEPLDIRTARPTESKAEFIIEAPMRWDGVHSAYKYTAEAVLQRDSEIIDKAVKNFGLREFTASRDGFFKLNSLSLPLNGAALKRPFDVEKDASLLRDLDANVVLIDGVDPEEKILEKCDELGVMVFFLFESTGSGDDFDELKRVTRLLSAHPSAAFICYTEADPAYGKRFCSEVKGCSQGLFTAGVRDLMKGEGVNDAIPDELLLYAGASADKNDFGGLEKRYEEMISARPDQRFAVLPVFREDYTLSTEKEDAAVELSTWHERMWNIFGTKKNTVCYFTGDLADRNGKNGQNGLVTCDRKKKKDVFWFYKAHFSADRFIKIASLPETVSTKTIPLKFYTNSSLPVLSVNGKTKKKLLPVKLSPSVYVFEKVKLKRKENTIKLSCENNADEARVFRSKKRKTK